MTEIILEDQPALEPEAPRVVASGASFGEVKKVHQTAGGYKVNDQFFVAEDGSDNCDLIAVKDFLAAGGVISRELSITESLKRKKIEKIQEIKAVRDAKNIEPITDTSAEIINEDSGEAMGSNTFFVFHTSRHPTNPAADPSAILTGIIMLNHAVPYSTKDISGAKVTVEITPAIARSLAAHLALRNNNNYKLADAIVNAINAATTEEEVNAITWSVGHL